MQLLINSCHKPVRCPPHPSTTGRRGHSRQPQVQRAQMQNRRACCSRAQPKQPTSRWTVYRIMHFCGRGENIWPGVTWKNAGGRWGGGSRGAHVWRSAVAGPAYILRPAHKTCNELGMCLCPCASASLYVCVCASKNASACAHDQKKKQD